MLQQWQVGKNAHGRICAVMVCSLSDFDLGMNTLILRLSSGSIAQVGAD